MRRRRSSAPPRQSGAAGARPTRPTRSERPVRSVRSVRRLLSLLSLFVALFGVPGASRAQGGVAREGAIFLLVPIGARAVGLGQAVAAAEPGSEGVWWNPASLARLDRKEAGISHSQTLVAGGTALTMVVPAGRAGVLAGALFYLDYGRQENTDAYGTTIGQSSPNSLVLAATYAATLGSRMRAGVTYKFLQDRVVCSGDCTGIASYSASTSAFDFGVQAVADRARRLTVGVAVRNVGFRFQVNDVEQADPLPVRVHAGARYAVGAVDRVVKGGALHIGADLVDRLAFANPSVRGGAEFTYREQFFLRAGYATGSGDVAGAAVGLGVQRGGLSMDLARVFGGFSADLGTPPTHVTLRFRF